MSMSVINKAEKEWNIALERLKTVQTNEELEEATKFVDIARSNLLSVSDEFRDTTQRNMEYARTQAMISMSPHIGTMPMSVGVSRGGITYSPINTKHEEIWACKRCGSKNVNWKMIGNRKQQRTYKKKMGVRKNLIVAGSVRYCIKCSQELKRDVLLEKISLAELQIIKQKVHEESVT